MKKLNPLILSLIQIWLIYDLALAQSKASLDANKLSTGFNADGYFFSDGMEAPKGSGLQSIFGGGLWIGGLAPGGDLHLAGSTYRQSGMDVFYGPIAKDYSSPEYATRFNRVWKISAQQVTDHINNYKKPGYTVPDPLKNWPGNGNVGNGEAAQLAPYVDVNSNDQYDPENGDYPDIKGDQAVFFIMNDARSTHTEFGGKTLGIEVHGMGYAFAMPSDSALDQTIFLKLKIYNRSVLNYDSLYVGFWGDMDLGFAFDDYVGCDTLRNMYYTYNGSNNDQGPTGYGSRPPAQGAVFLNHPISHFFYYKNEVSAQGNPSNAQHIYNYLSGSWKDGTPMTYGGSGYGGTTRARFMFSGTPEDGTGWTEVSAGNPPGDRRGVMSVGPFAFDQGKVLCLDLAFPFARDYQGDHLSSLALLRQRADRVIQFYKDLGQSCEFISTGVSEKHPGSGLQLFPNPGNGVVQFKGLAGPELRTVHLMDGQGRILGTYRVSAAQPVLVLSHLNPGLYQLMLRDNSGSIVNIKYLKAQ